MVKHCLLSSRNRVRVSTGAPISIEGFRDDVSHYARVGERRVQTHCMVMPRVPLIYSRLVCNGSNLAFEAESGGSIPSAGANFFRKMFDGAMHSATTR